MTDTLQQTVKEMEEIADDTYEGFAGANTIKRWLAVIKPIADKLPMGVQDAGRKGGEANTPLQQQARLKNLPNKKGEKK